MAHCDSNHTRRVRYRPQNRAIDFGGCKYRGPANLEANAYAGSLRLRFRVQGLKAGQNKKRYKARIVGGEVAEDLFNRGLCPPAIASRSGEAGGPAFGDSYDRRRS